MSQLFAIFLNVITPVFSLAALGYFAGPKLQLDARTLSRFAYFILIPAFVFDVMSAAQIDLALTARMALSTIAVHLGCAALGFAAARALRRTAQMTAAYMLIAIFGNVGNFGLPIVQFRFPDEPRALEISTVYFLAIMVVSFVVGVAAANWHRGGSVKAALAVIKTPALLVLPPAIVVNALDLSIPPMVGRAVSLLAAAMIPTMIVALGVQLASAGLPRLNSDMILSAGIRLLGGPLLAVALAGPFGLGGVERSIGIIQASMPAAVLTSIIAFENDLIPEFVTAAVLFSTVASIVTLTIALALV
ncbi:MAG: AEC family transporter [Chloroflexi bacterium]|nr:AEC family transporter [Chloroflexota bacterium]